MASAILVAIDDDEARKSIISELVKADEIELCIEAADGLEAVEVADHFTPDVVVMDTRMPRLDGIEATDRICRGANPPKVIILVDEGDEGFVTRALGAGATGVILKSHLSTHLLAAIRTVVNGKHFVMPS